MPKFEVIVGNVGTIYIGDKPHKAESGFRMYTKASKDGIGRAAGEPVTLFKDGEPIKEYVPVEEYEER